MSATVKTYFGRVVVDGGSRRVIGDLDAPISEQTIPGTYMDGEYRITLAPGEKRMLWEYTRQRDFEKLDVRIIGDGYLSMAWLVDRPVSASNLNPSTSYRRVRHLDLSCGDVLTLNSDQGLMHATQSLDNGFDGASYLPSAWQDAGVESGKLYAVFAWNRSSTASVQVGVTVLN